MRPCRFAGESSFPALADDPGRSEIIADLEQAIGEKCDKVLAPHKTVVSTDEVKKIISEMGPVEGEAKKENSQEESASAKGPRAPRRFCAPVSPIAGERGEMTRRSDRHGARWSLTRSCDRDAYTIIGVRRER